MTARTNVTKQMLYIYTTKYLFCFVDLPCYGAVSAMRFLGAHNSKIRYSKITLMGRTCWDWKAGNRILHFLCLSWMTGTCPTNAYLYPSLLHCLCGARWHPRILPTSQQQKALTRMAHWSCHWTVKKYKIMSSTINGDENQASNSCLG